MHEQDIQAKETELRKTVQSQWIATAAAGLFAVATMVLFFFPSLRNWQAIIPIGLVGLLYIRRTMAIKQAAQELSQELAQLKQELAESPETWPPPPRNPNVL